MEFLEETRNYVEHAVVRYGVWYDEIEWTTWDLTPQQKQVDPSF